jgi:cytoskeletal protein CcmA (bactofilin family)
MASTYTSNSGVEKPGIGDQSGEWGTTVNTNMDILDRAINGVGVITLSGTTHTLTTTDGALSDGQYKVLVLSGSPSGTNTITISPNDQDKLYFVVNSSGQTATFSQGSGANVSVVNGDTKIIYADGAGSGAAVTEFASETDALEGITAGTVSASKAVIVDANKDITGFRNVTLTGELDAGSLDISGNADIDGTLEADAITLNGTALGSLYSPIAGSSSIVTTGALNSGSITSGFGTINNGSSAITTTGVITGGTVEATTDTAAGDNAAIGYTSAEGLILTGQGSTSDITFKNDADATVFSIPTGTDDILFPDGAKALFGAGSDLQIYHDGNDSYVDDAGTGILFLRGNSAVKIRKYTGEAILDGNADGSVVLYYDNAAKLATSASGVTATGTLNATTSLDSPLAAIRNPSAGQLYLRNLSNINRIDSYDDPISATYPLQVNASQMTFLIGDSEKMRLDTNGKLGIGTTTPASYTSDTLVISSGDQGGMTLVSADNVENYISWADGTSGAAQLQAGFIGYNHASNYLRLGTSATERMRIASDGKVGIGTSSPDGRLHVHTSSAGTVTAATDANQLVLESTANVGMSFLTGNASAARIKFGDPDSNSSGAIVYAHSDNSMRFNTAGSERMRIDSSGNLLVGTTNTSLGIGNTNTGFQVENNGTFLASRADNIAGSLNRNNDGTILTLRRSGNEVGTIVVTSSSTSYNSLSDYRLKENVNYTFDATTRLKQLKPARFNFISDDTNTLIDGFIAHEVSSVVPEAITGEKDAVDENGDAVYQGIDQSKLVPLLVKTIQELEARITALEAG